MKQGKRVLALLLALVMLAGLLPWNQLRLIPTAEAATDPPVVKKLGQDNMTIDYEFEKTNGITDAAGAFRLLAESQYARGNPSGIENANLYSLYQQEYNQFYWNHADHWTKRAADSGAGDLRYYLSSKNTKHTYVCLSGDDSHEFAKHAEQWETIKITRDKVLDLNGHVMDFRLNTNWDHNNKEQLNDVIEQSHHEVLFEIEDGATLTIIDSSAWRGENGGRGTGRISFTGWIVNPYSEHGDFWTYTTRDMFHVNNGNLVIYGGSFQAGNKKSIVKKDSLWGKIKNAIGSAVELGTSIAGYATGINTAVAGYQDVLKMVTNNSVLSLKEDGATSADSTIKEDGKTPKPPDEVTKDTPQKAGGDYQTISEKRESKDAGIQNGKQGTAEGENKKDKDKPAKDDSNTKLAEAENKIVNQVLNQGQITDIVNNAFGLVDNIIGCFDRDIPKTQVTVCILGTVVKVGANGSFASYGGTYQGYGSTPNTRNAVVEVVKLDGVKTFDHSKSQGGLAYIYGGTFEANNGANVFNMVKTVTEEQTATMYEGFPGSEPRQVVLKKSETNGLKVLMYENEDELETGTGTPIPVNTANIQVRGGTFRCYYDLINCSLKPESTVGDQEEKFTKFPGTRGSVNLGVESFNTNLIEDGRIQISDVYGDGALVLLDDRVAEKEAYLKEHPGGTFPESLYHYRLFCGDRELRAKHYLHVSPNTAKTNAAHSLQLSYYSNSPAEDVVSIYKNDKENERAPYRQTETYFDFNLGEGNTSSYAIIPLFYVPESQDEQARMDVYGEHLAESEIWYYPEPKKADGSPLGDAAYGDGYYTGNMIVPKENEADEPLIFFHKLSQHYDDRTDQWYDSALTFMDPATLQYQPEYHQGVRTSMGYYTYRLYRVDPLTRENLSESKTYGVDKPLLEVRYGGSRESLRCKLPLIETQNWILNHQKELDVQWEGYKSGEMYRVELDWEEYMGLGYQGNGRFGGQLDKAKTVASILFRCVDSTEREEAEDGAYLDVAYTPVQLISDHTYSTASYNQDLRIPTITAGDYATVQILNGKAGMTDYNARHKIFDLYYQWWECKENGEPIRLIAGTDNIYNEDLPYKKEWHWWKGSWNMAKDGKIYRNTVDPNDPRAYTYIYDGLPGFIDEYGHLTADKDKWSCYNLHMYTQETVDNTLITGDGTDQLSLRNNNVMATNSDSCYIPEELAGKFIKVKVVVLNEDWPRAYDKKQTLWSHVIRVKAPVKPVTGEINFKYTGDTEYAAAGKDVTISVKNVTGLGTGEKLVSLRYWVNGATKEFTDQTLNPKKLPTVKYPSDFYSAEDSKNLKAFDVPVFVYLKTDKRSEVFRVPNAKFRFEVEATGMKLSGQNRIAVELEKIQNGIGQPSSYRPIVPDPYNASVGYSYQDAGSTDPKVATLDENGYVVFHGGTGTTTLSVTGPGGVTVSAEVFVYTLIQNVSVSGLTAPTVNQTLPPYSATPAEAPYSVANLYWTRDRGEEPLSANHSAQNYHTYTVNVELQAAENHIFADKRTLDFQLSARLADGSTQLLTREILEKVYSGKLEYRLLAEDRLLLSYTFKGLVGEAESLINKIYMDFAPAIAENSNFDLWLEEANFFTNGDDSEFVKTTPQPWGTNILVSGAMIGALGHFDSVDTDIHAFLKQAITGVQYILSIPNELQATFPTTGADISLYLNGQLTEGMVSSISNKAVWVMAGGMVKVVDGIDPEPFPVYRLKNFELGQNQALYVPDLLDCQDPRVSVHYLECTHASLNPEDYLAYDEWEETLTVKQAGSGFRVTFQVWFDLDQDDHPEYTQSHTVVKELRTTGASVSTAAGTTVSVTAYEPDGTTVAYSQQAVIPAGWGNLENFSIPEIPNAFISKVSSVQNPDAAVSLTYGAKRLSHANLGSGDTALRVYTVPADSLTIHPGSTEAYAYMKDPEGSDVQGVNLSLDGVHFLRTDHLTDLTPDTEYVLYYRQGVDGTIYYKTFRTAETDYGLYLDRIIVTPEHLGSLETEGWNYDPNTQTLRLKNLNLAGKGTVWMYLIAIPVSGIIYAKQDLTVELIGENVIESTVDFARTIESLGNLTIQGSGNLTMKGPASVNSSGYVSTYCSGLDAIKDLNLRGSGQLTFTSLSSGIGCGNDYNINYSNGNLIFTGGSSNSNASSLTSQSNASRLVFSGMPHDLDIVAGGNSMTVEQLIAYLQGTRRNEPVSVKPRHTFNQDVVSAAYLADGNQDCTLSCAYYYSCSCGAKGSTKFYRTMPSHNLTVHHDGLAPSCIVGGYQAYDECANCAYTTYQELPPLGHDWEYHPELAPTCTEDGKPAYNVCKTCGLTNEVEIPTDVPTRDGAPAMTVSDHYDTEIQIWKAHGHDLKRVAAQPATCTQDGVMELYQCIYCGKCFSDENCGAELSATDQKIPATGHAWTMWTITTEPTETQEGVKTRTCETCGATETGEVPTSEWNPFVDVKRDSYYFSAVKNLFEVEVVNGTSATTFSPNQPCTRAQVVTFLWRLAGSPATTISNPFTDVKPGAWYYNAVLWAAESHITTGTSATAFSPNLICSRAQAVTLLWRAMGSPEPESTVNPFTDVNPNAWYYKAMLWALENGVTNGTGAESFSPDKACSRAQTVTLLDRVNSLPQWEDDLAVSENPEGGVIDPASSDPCYILSADGEFGLAPYSYEWYMSDGTRAPAQKIEGATLSSLAAFEPGSYYCVITDAVGDSVTTDSALVTLKDYPDLTALTQPVGGICTPGNPLTLSFGVTGGAGNLVYTWYRDGEEYDSSYDPALTLDCKPGSYMCVVTDRIGQTLESDTVKVSYGGANRVNLLGDDEFLMYVSDVFKITGVGVVVIGTVNNGTVHTGETIKVWHDSDSNGNLVCSEYSVVGIESGQHQILSSASAGDYVRLLLNCFEKDNFVPGDTLCSVTSKLMPVTGTFVADVHVNREDEGGRKTPLFENARMTIKDTLNNVVLAYGNVLDLGCDSNGDPYEMCMPGSDSIGLKFGNLRTTSIESEGIPKPCIFYVGQTLLFTDSTYTVARMTITDVIPNSVEVNETNFPDPVFRNAVIDNYDNDIEDGWLNEVELNRATEYSAASIGTLTSLKGIEFFYNLGELNVTNCPNITSLDLRGNKKLYYLDLCCDDYDHSNLTELRLEGLTELDYLNLENSGLPSLDVSDCTKLKTLYCHWSPGLRELKLGTNSTLSILYAHKTALASLDISGCPILLDHYQNGTVTPYYDGDVLRFKKTGVAGELYVNKNTVVIPAANPGYPDWVEVNETNFPDEIFYDYVLSQFDRNSDGWLNPDELSNATYFFAEGSGNLTSLKGIELLYALDDLDVGECGLTSVDLRGNRNLTSVYLYGNPLRELHMDGLSELSYLHVGETNLSSLDLSQHPKLNFLFTYDCDNLTVLDIRSCPILVNVYKNAERKDYVDANSAYSYKIDGVGELIVDKSLTVIAD